MDTERVARAFADEVRAEMARQRVTARGMQDAVGEGLSSSAYQKYFVQQTRAIPSDVQLAVCQVLGLRTSEMWRRAEDAAARPVDPIDAEILAGMSGRGRALAAELDPGPVDSAPAERPTRRRRSS